MKRPALWIAAVVTLPALLVGGGGVPVVHAQKPLVKLTAAMGSQGILWTAYYVAVDQGFFAQEGLEVEHLNAPAANTLTAVISGNAHVAAATVHLITGRSKGEAIKAFVVLKPGASLDLDGLLAGEVEGGSAGPADRGGADRTWYHKPRRRRAGQGGGGPAVSVAMRPDNPNPNRTAAGRVRP